MSLTLSALNNDRSFTDKIIEISGEPIRRCMQCGTCSGVCPMEASTSLTPRRLIHLALLGKSEAIEKSNTAWMCASCHTCEVRCPRSLDVPKIIEAIRLAHLRHNVNYVEPNAINREDMHEIPQIALVSSFRKHTA